MSRSKDSTSKKRKLADIDKIEAHLLPRKTQVLADGSCHGSRDDTFEPGHEPAFTTKGSEPESGTAILIELQEKPPSTGELDINGQPNVQTLDLESRAVKDMASQDGTQGLSKSNPKDTAALRQAKSERRSKKRKLEQADTAAVTEASKPSEAAFPTPEDEKDQQRETPVSQQIPAPNPSKPEPNQRFIVFVGNLPYTATNSTIRTHFSKLEPFTMRHSTDKSTGRSRGFAFLEFEGYDKMKTCLKLYHHTLFEAGGVGEDASLGSGKKRKNQARRINIELTAGGGGGKSEARKERIKGKNEKLEGERERARLHREKEEAAARRKKRKAAGEKTGANAVEVTGGRGDVQDENIHPSRRKRMKT